MRQPDGFVLLEALLALAILAIAIGGPLAASREAVHAVESQYRRERDVRGADWLLTSVALWSSSDLDRHLGWSQQGNLMLQVTRSVNGNLYAVEIADDARRTLLVTSLYRAEQ